MGAEMIIDSVTYPREGFTPDWKAGQDYIKNLGKEGTIIEDDIEYLLEELEQFKEAFTTGTRESTVHTVSSYYVLLTGGSTWGNSPTELSGCIGNLNEHSILDACGFYQDRDWKGILDKVIDEGGSTLLPLLMNFDPELDILIRKKLKGE